jgi:hypothetical protein
MASVCALVATPVARGWQQRCDAARVRGVIGRGLKIGPVGGTAPGGLGGLGTQGRTPYRTNQLFTVDRNCGGDLGELWRHNDDCLQLLLLTTGVCTSQICSVHINIVPVDGSEISMSLEILRHTRNTWHQQLCRKHDHAVGGTIEFVRPHNVPPSAGIFAAVGITCPGAHAAVVAPAGQPAGPDAV